MLELPNYYQELFQRLDPNHPNCLSVDKLEDEGHSIIDNLCDWYKYFYDEITRGLENVSAENFVPSIGMAIKALQLLIPTLYGRIDRIETTSSIDYNSMLPIIAGDTSTRYKKSEHFDMPYSRMGYAVPIGEQTITTYNSKDLPTICKQKMYVMAARQDNNLLISASKQNGCAWQDWPDCYGEQPQLTTIIEGEVTTQVYTARATAIQAIRYMGEKYSAGETVHLVEDGILNDDGGYATVAAMPDSVIANNINYTMLQNVMGPGGWDEYGWFDVDGFRQCFHLVKFPIPISELRKGKTLQFDFVGRKIADREILVTEGYPSGVYVKTIYWDSGWTMPYSAAVRKVEPDLMGNWHIFLWTNPTAWPDGDVNLWAELNTEQKINTIYICDEDVERTPDIDAYLFSIDPYMPTNYWDWYAEKHGTNKYGGDYWLEDVNGLTEVELYDLNGKGFIFTTTEDDSTSGAASASETITKSFRFMAIGYDGGFINTMSLSEYVEFMLQFLSWDRIIHTTFAAYIEEKMVYLDQSELIPLGKEFAVINLSQKPWRGTNPFDGINVEQEYVDWSGEEYTDFGDFGKIVPPGISAGRYVEFLHYFLEKHPLLTKTTVASVFGMRMMRTNEDIYQYESDATFRNSVIAVIKTYMASKWPEFNELND